MAQRVKEANIATRPTFRDMAVIWDTGASIGLTPFRADFIDYQPLEGVEVKDIARANAVLGVGTVMWKFHSRLGKEIFLPAVCYHVEHATIRLLSPQLYFKEHGGHATVEGHNVAFHLPEGSIVDIPVDPKTNLPAVRDAATTKKQQLEAGPHLMATPLQREMDLDYRVGIGGYVRHTPVSPANGAANMNSFCHPCVADETNQNLTSGQKELLQWHWKLAINMKHVQELMKPRAYKIGDETRYCRPVIPTKFKDASTCQVPKCMSCELAAMKRRSTRVKTTKVVKEREGALKQDSYDPGDMISSDQFSVTTPGRHLSGYGRESVDTGFKGGTVYVDSASGLIRVQPQSSLGAEETLLGKQRFEQWIWDLAAVCAKRYHSDHGIYDSEEFMRDCTGKGQKQTFSGVGAKHQNAIAERSIQTICYWARTMMVHAAIHWPADGADNLRLWAFAIKQAEWIHNRMPNRVTGLTPLEIFTKTKSDHRDLLRSHVWGCPVYVLDPSLQDGKKIPKWNRRSRLGQFLGFSDEHSSLVAKVRHLRTQHVSPQFHVVFDDLFQTVNNPVPLDETKAGTILDELFNQSRDSYVDLERDSDGTIVYEPPPLDDIWLSEEERRDKRVILQERRDRARDRELRRQQELAERQQREDPTSFPTGTPSPRDRSRRDIDPPVVLDNGSFDDDDGDSSDDEPPPDGPPPADPGHAARGDQPQPRQFLRRGRGSAPRRLIEDASWQNVLQETPERFPCTLGSKQPPVLASEARRKRSNRCYNAQLERRRQEYEEFSLNNLEWGEYSSLREFVSSELEPLVRLSIDKTTYGLDPNFDIGAFTAEYIEPMMLAAKTTASDADNPNWNQAMNGPFAEEYWEAAKCEVETLEKIDTWEVVERQEDMNVLPSTWAFKCKRFPDGTVKKFKARFCARGDRQKEGVDYFDTYSPVVQWTTIRLMLILECLMELKSKQGDVACAFLHAHLEPGEKVYLEMPRGFKQYDKRGRPKVLSLKRCQYGLRQSPRGFWKYMTQQMEACGLKQSKLDPCLFIGPTVIAVIYIDDCIFWSATEDSIYEVGTKLRELGVQLEEEGDAAGFLGVDLERLSDGRIHMTQKGLIARIVSAVGLNMSETKTKSTPAERKPITKDEEGEPSQESFSYASVVGMLLYLSGHTRPDLAYSVSQVARFMFAPKRSHELALKRIARYLVGTADKGLILSPKSRATSFDIDAYPDADFAGLYGHEKCNDPVCVRSRTGYVIAVAGCPVLVKSQLQTETALSTMQAEVYAMASCMKELIPLVDMVKELRQAVGLNEGRPPVLKITLHEDNSGALILAKTIPPQFTPRSKFYALKTIWFRERIAEMVCSVEKVETLEQWGDIATKMPPVNIFEHLRKLIQGW